MLKIRFACPQTFCRQHTVQHAIHVPCSRRLTAEISHARGSTLFDCVRQSALWQWSKMTATVGNSRDLFTSLCHTPSPLSVVSRWPPCSLYIQEIKILLLTVEIYCTTIITTQIQLGLLLTNWRTAVGIQTETLSCLNPEPICHYYIILYYIR